MSINLLSCMQSFADVVNYQGFANAARHKHTSAPVLTKQIQWLEKHLNKQLFHRTTRSVELTEAGELYYQQVKIILNQILEAKNAINNMETEPHGKLNIGVPPGMTSYFFANKVKNFLIAYPKICCNLVGQLPPSAVNDEIADLVISSLDINDKTLVKELLFSGESGIFAAPGYLEKHGIPKNIEDLKNHNCLINLRFTPDCEWHFAGGKKIKLCGNFRSNTGTDIYYAGLNGIGLFLSLKGLVQDDLNAKRLIEIPLEQKSLTVKMYVYHKIVPKNSIIRLFADYLIEEMSQCRWC